MNARSAPARSALPVLPALALSLGGFAFSACSNSAELPMWVEPVADVGDARSLVITDAYGRAESKDVVNALALDHARTGATGAWFTEVSTSRARLESDGRDAWIGRDEALPRGSLFLRLDVLEDSAVVSSNDHVDVGPGGEVVYVDEDEHLLAHTLLGVTVADAGGIVLDSYEVEGVHERTGLISDWDIEDAQNIAATAAVDAALVLITPTLTTVDVPLDDRDQPALELTQRALSGDTDAVTALAARKGTAAAYNYAVVVDEAGDPRAALPLYRAAAAAENAADFYAETLALAEDRVATLDRLGL